MANGDSNGVMSVVAIMTWELILKAVFVLMAGMLTCDNAVCDVRRPVLKRTTMSRRMAGVFEEYSQWRVNVIRWAWRVDPI